MPCAAASSSIATIVRVFSAMSPSRRAANVAMLTWSSWLADVGQAVDARRMRERLVLRRERRGGDVRHHEAGVEPGSRTRNGGKPRQRRIDQQRDAPLGERADLGDRQRQDVGGERDRLGVEVAAREDLARFREHERIVGHRVRLDEQRRGDVADQVEAGAHHLRLAAQAVRILHAIVVDQVRAANLAAGEQHAIRSPRRRSVPAGRAASWMRASNGASLPLAASTDSAPADDRRGEQVLGLEQCLAAPARSRPACRSAARGLPWRRARAAQVPRGARPSRGAQRDAVDAHFALAHQRQRHVRERRQIARGADRALAPESTARRRRCRARAALRSTSGRTPE